MCELRISSLKTRLFISVSKFWCATINHDTGPLLVWVCKKYSKKKSRFVTAKALFAFSDNPDQAYVHTYIQTHVRTCKHALHAYTLVGHRDAPVFWVRGITIVIFLESTCGDQLTTALAPQPVCASTMLDWCCFYFFVRNSLVALLEFLCARIFSLDSWISVFPDIFFLCVCMVSNKAFLPLLSTRLLCLVVAIHSSSVLIVHVCLCVCASVCACENV